MLSARMQAKPAAPRPVQRGLAEHTRQTAGLKPARMNGMEGLLRLCQVGDVSCGGSVFGAGSAETASDRDGSG